jgi:hypothetical protein
VSDPSSYWSTPPPGADGQPGMPGTPGTPLAAPGARRSPVPAIIVVVLALAVPVAVLAVFLAGRVTSKTFSSTVTESIRTIAPRPPITAAPSPVSTTVGLGAEKKWRSLGVSLSCAPYGAWRGTARLRNEGATKRTATFSWTVRRGDVVVATLHAAAHDVPAGGVVATQIVAAERCAPGAARATFHVVASF